ncbi:MAG TPA: signal peptide peptidase SppA [Rubrivivax sp.]
MARERRGVVRKVLGGLWWLIDGGRRLVFNLLFLALVFGLVLAFVASRPAKLQDKTVLVLDLSGPIVEQRAGSARDAALKRLRGDPGDETRLRDVIAVLDAAAKDAKIERVLLVLEGLSGGGPASQREVAAAVERFKASGKQVVAWGNGYDQRQYFIAAHANEVYVHPMGLVSLEGYGRLRNYYRDAFDRLGVDANVLRVGKYKNAGEPFVASAPSQETLESDAFLYDALWALYTQGVERARQLPVGSIGKLIDALPGSLKAVGGDLAQLALQAKLVDGLKTSDELRKLLIERGAEDKDKKSFRQVGFGEYLARIEPARGGDAVGVLVAEGAIVDGAAPAGRIGGKSTAALIRKAREDERIKALVLRVDSPGGSAFGSELVRRELELTRAAGKPVVVSMGDVAASGGYWISLAADEVIADAATITGSIGVFAMLPTAEGLLDKLSVRTGGYSTTWLGTAYDPRKALDPRYAALVQASIDRIYADFTGKVAAARKTTPQKIDEVAQGRVWTGAQAQERGLVDRTGTYADALAAARKLGKLADDAPVHYVEPDASRFERVLGFFDASVAASIGQALGLPSAGLLPAALRDMQAELGWIADVAEGRKPFSVVLHCLCEPAP